MKKIAGILMLIALIASSAYAESSTKMKGNTMQKIFRTDDQRTMKGPDDWFTGGEVTVRMIFPHNDVARYSGAFVTFQPGARTNWHLHPAGQHIIVTDGTALTGTRDGSVHKAHEGDAVWCPPDIDHWHGATPDATMTHLVITGVDEDDQNVHWKEKVTDEQYRGE